MDHVPYIVNWVCIAYRLHSRTYYFVSHNLLHILPFLPRKTIMVFTFSFFIICRILCFVSLQYITLPRLVILHMRRCKKTDLKESFKVLISNRNNYKKWNNFFLQISCESSPWENLENLQSQSPLWFEKSYYLTCFACEQYKVDIIQQNDC